MDPELLKLFAWLIPLPPLIAFGLIVLFTQPWKGLSHWLAIGSVLLSFILAQFVFWNVVSTGIEINAAIPWLSAGMDTSKWLNFGIRVDPLTAVMLFMVPLTCLMIFIYSVGYMGWPARREGVKTPPGLAAGISLDPLYSRFFAFISLFAFAMLLLVVADNLLLLFVGWEIMGLCSYLLIGFWYQKPAAYRAAVKAFMTTRVGDVLMMLGIAYLYFHSGTLTFSQVLTNKQTLDAMAATPSFVGGLSVAALIGLLLFAGTVGKSAQFPLHIWLPDAMEGPTPVSAMIHAATMVSAGVYMVIRMFPLLQAGSHEGVLTLPMVAMAVIGTFSALFAATIALAQNDIKRVLAYSTISQLAYMVAALGIGAYVAAAFHLITHAFFKALLFLGSGSVIHGMEHGEHAVHEMEAQAAPHAPFYVGEGEHYTYAPTGQHAEHGRAAPPEEPEGIPFAQNMLNMGGLAKRMPWTYLTFLIGGLALSGFPIITAGFWSKDEILAEAFNKGSVNPGALVVFIVLALAAFLTAFYTARQIGLTFLGRPRTAAAEHASESSTWIVFPLIILAVLAVSAGWAGIPNNFLGLELGPINWFHGFVSKTVEGVVQIEETLPFSPVPLLTSVVAALGGLALGFWLYAWRRPLATGEADPLVGALGELHTVLQNKYYIDELYHAIFIRPTEILAEAVVYQAIDKGIIDGILHGIARAALWVAEGYRAFDRGVVHRAGDEIAESIKGFGRSFRTIQTGRVQEYLLLSLVAAVAFGLFFYFFIGVRP